MTDTLEIVSWHVISMWLALGSFAVCAGAYITRLARWLLARSRNRGFKSVFLPEERELLDRDLPHGTMDLEEVRDIDYDFNAYPVGEKATLATLYRSAGEKPEVRRVYPSRPLAISGARGSRPNVYYLKGRDGDMPGDLDLELKSGGDGLRLVNKGGSPVLLNFKPLESGTFAYIDSHCLIRQNDSVLKILLKEI